MSVDWAPVRQPDACGAIGCRGDTDLKQVTKAGQRRVLCSDCAESWAGVSWSPAPRADGCGRNGCREGGGLIRLTKNGQGRVLHSEGVNLKQVRKDGRVRVLCPDCAQRWLA